MCLDIRKKLKPIRVGYKVFYTAENSRQLQGRFANVGLNEKPRPVGKWLKEEDFRDPGSASQILMSRNSYKKGWHVYKTYEVAEGWAISRCQVRKVRIREIVASGLQNGEEVWVCKKIFILPKSAVKRRKNGRKD